MASSRFNILIFVPNRNFCGDCSLEKPFLSLSFFPPWIHLPPLFQVIKDCMKTSKKAHIFNVGFHLSHQPRVAAERRNSQPLTMKHPFGNIGFWIKNSNNLDLKPCSAVNSLYGISRFSNSFEALRHSVLIIRIVSSSSNILIWLSLELDFCRTGKNTSVSSKMVSHGWRKAHTCFYLLRWV